jgi:hypothetical protein
MPLAPSRDTLLSILAASVTVAIAAAAIAPGCARTCARTLDCSDGYCSEGVCTTDCITHDDCRAAGTGLWCNAFRRCSGDVATAPEQHTAPPITRITSDGAELPPGAGITFVVDHLAIAGADDGLDINNSCATRADEDCSDNALAPLGELGNDQIDAGLRQGVTLLIVEIAGIDEPYSGDDEDVTLKLYVGRDADNLPSNNFREVQGSSRPCCEFEITRGSLINNRPKSIAPAKIVRGRIYPLFPTQLEFPLQVGEPGSPDVRIERALIAGRLSPDLSAISEGLLGGAVPMQILAGSSNPYCGVVDPRCAVAFSNSTLLDLVTSLIAPMPDIDLDQPGDGIDCVVDRDQDGHVDRCCDGVLGASCVDGTKCNGREIAPLIPGDDQSCVMTPAMRDGYSVALGFTARRAVIRGITE